jgi:3-demethoxyubiquinol 3-hydroxylase
MKASAHLRPPNFPTFFPIYTEPTLAYNTPNLMYPQNAFSRLSPLDRWIAAADNALRTLSGTSRSTVACPQPPSPSSIPLSPAEQKQSGALMRVNHVGEICAQALYSAQQLAAQDAVLAQHFAKAAGEETQHLVWTQQRLQELAARPSMLNPVWYAGAFTVGWLAGQAGRSWSLGFVVETERQVARHLQSHLERLPANDLASKAIVAQMQLEESHHAQQAQAAGAAALPLPLRWMMRAAAKVMTTTAHWV